MSSATTRTPYGMFWPPVYYGTTPMLDGCHTDGSSTCFSSLSALQAIGARTFINFTNGSVDCKDPATSAFSLAMWKSAVSRQAARTTTTQMNSLIDDGTIVAFHMLDDLEPGSPVFPGGVPSFADIEAMAQYAKSFFSRLPCMVRVNNTYLQSIAPASGYTYLDFGWAQWQNSYGSAQPYFQNNVNAGFACGLGTMAGFNIDDGGSGSEPAWRFHPGQASKFGMSPNELTAVADAFSQLSTLIGNVGWKYLDPTGGTPSYYNKTSIQTALSYLAGKAIGRVMGPLNTRGLSQGTQPVVVGGQWGVLGSVSGNRTGSPAAMNMTYPTGIGTQNLICSILYSRDASAKSWLLPSGWAEAGSISGTSHQGGQLCVFYKVATGFETGSQTFTLSGPGSTAEAVTGKMFVISGNSTSGVSAVLAKVGSARSWSDGTSNMGPVPGITSTISDALILIVAGKTNDFNNGDPVPDATMSATTGDGQTWNRLFLSTNLSGDDLGLLCDYAFTSGLPSITTKSWSQSSGAGSNASGSGCGLMIAFAPYRIITGTPPSIVELQDFGITVQSTFSLTFGSSGSTPITWSLTTKPSNATLNASTGQLNWTPLSAGTYFFGVQAVNSFGTDTASMIATATTSSATTTSGGTGPIFVNPPLPPGSGDRTVKAHDLISFLAQATSANTGNVVTYALAPGAPAGAFLDAITGQFIWLPSEEQGPGIYPIVINATDGILTSGSTFTVTVQDVPWTREHGFTNRFQRYP